MEDGIEDDALSEGADALSLAWLVETGLLFVSRPKFTGTSYLPASARMGSLWLDPCDKCSLICENSRSGDFGLLYTKESSPAALQDSELL